MTNKTIVINLATNDTNHLFGYLAKETPHDNPEIVDLIMRPAIQNISCIRTVTFRFLREGENFIKKTFNGQPVYIIFQDSEGNSAIYGALQSDNIETIARLKKEKHELRGNINKLDTIIDEHNEDQETKDFKKAKLRRDSRGANRSLYSDDEEYQSDRNRSPTW